MPFLADEFLPIPNQDLLSWMFDEQEYDPDQPVGAGIYRRTMYVADDWMGRYTSMLCSLAGRYLPAKLEFLLESFVQGSMLQVSRGGTAFAYFRSTMYGYSLQRKHHADRCRYIAQWPSSGS